MGRWASAWRDTSHPCEEGPRSGLCDPTGAVAITPLAEPGRCRSKALSFPPPDSVDYYLPAGSGGQFDAACPVLPDGS